MYGSPGTGKSHLAWALVREVTHRCPELVARVLAAGDLGPTEDRVPGEFWDCDLLVLEDLQHLSPRLAPLLTQKFDQLLAHNQQMIFTARVGPARLDELPTRLANRLASGLVVSLGPLSAATRLEILIDRAQRRQIAVTRPVLTWLADHLTSGRQLDGALNRLELLARSSPGPLDVATVAEHFRTEVSAARPTIDRIARQVGGYFRLDAKDLQSRRRQQHVLVPRQLGMYLARQLTESSLAEIGAYFGGRDHTTVLHACRKVEEVLAHDAVLSGAVHQLHADLGCG